MNASQKQRAKDALQKWHSSNDDSLREYQSAELMAALLQELVDAHEPKPVARVTGYYAGYLSIATVDGRVLPAGTALYAAPPAPSVPDNVARDAARMDWLDERNAPHGLGWEIIQMPAGNVHIHTLTGDKAKFGSIRDAIDAAMIEKGKQA